LQIEAKPKLAPRTKRLEVLFKELLKRRIVMQLIVRRFTFPLILR
jgi:hypothetical protein